MNIFFLFRLHTMYMQVRIQCYNNKVSHRKMKKRKEKKKLNTKITTATTTMCVLHGAAVIHTLREIEALEKKERNSMKQLTFSLERRVLHWARIFIEICIFFKIFSAFIVDSNVHVHVLHSNATIKLLIARFVSFPLI